MSRWLFSLNSAEISKQSKCFGYLLLCYQDLNHCTSRGVGLLIYPLYYFSSNCGDSLEQEPKALINVRNYSKEGSKSATPAASIHTATHLQLVVGYLGWAEGRISHDHSACWLSARVIRVMMSENVYRAKRFIFWMNFLDITSVKKNFFSA